MLWCDKVIEPLSGEQLINDSKTPSGRVHVGSLRGVLIHDAVFRALKMKGAPARYTYGVDDYDPLDELPAGRSAEFEPHLGKPLCNVPPPEGSTATDMAEHYIQEFFEIFRELGVSVEPYRMRDVYRSGKFDEAIDRILRHGQVVREVYLEVSGARRPDDWLPLQVVCENCGRIGTTEVTAYHEGRVDYHCRPDLVKWAKGCGNRSSIAPFGGRAKLPWKLEWVAKWATFGITIEGAGKDHTTRGGSRNVAEAALRKIYGKEPPLNIPYEFFLVEGAKMSSSKGVGASARDVADLLTPEALRFLMLSSLPKRPVNFSLAPTAMVKLFNDLDRLDAKAETSEDDRKLLSLCSATGEIEPRFRPSFQLLIALTQIPGVDIRGEMAKRKGSELTASDLKELDARLRVVRLWLREYAPEEARFEVRQEVPAAAATLSSAQRAFLVDLQAALPNADWDEDVIQGVLFDVAKLVPLPADQAFRAIYALFLGRESGPKAGCLISALTRAFVAERLRAVTVAKRDFWLETALSAEQFEKWLSENAASVVEPRAALKLSLLHGVGAGATEVFADGLAVIELTYKTNEKTHLKRVNYASPSIPTKSDLDPQTQQFVRRATEYLSSLAQSNGLEISVSQQVSVD